ncbi:Uncharacterised protein [Vibrio cholerae]|nr:Uncharacterised protein [Vibrio cholerae]
MVAMCAAADTVIQSAPASNAIRERMAPPSVVFMSHTRI